MKKTRLLVAILGLGLASVPQASAGVIESVDTGETGSLLAPGGWVGESFTTPSGGPWDNITFNFYSDTTTPYALGTLYLFDQVLPGVPSTLSSSDPGFIAIDTSIINGVWVFDPSVVLQPDTQYIAYSDALFTPGSIIGGGTVDYANFYESVYFRSAQLPYSTFTNTANFSLGGTPVSGPTGAVPEPGTNLLFSIGLMLIGVGFACRKQRRQKSL